MDRSPLKSVENATHKSVEKSYKKLYHDLVERHSVLQSQLETYSNLFRKMDKIEQLKVHVHTYSWYTKVDNCCNVGYGLVLTGPGIGDFIREAGRAGKSKPGAGEREGRLERSPLQGSSQAERIGESINRLILIQIIGVCCNNTIIT